MLNKVFLVGNLTKDPEGPRPAGQSTVASFRLAVNEKRGGEDRTMFIDCDCWNKTAEIVCQYMRKGSRVLIEGRLQLDEWGEGDQRRSKHKVVADRVQFLDSKDSGGGGGQGRGREAAPAHQSRRNHPDPHASAEHHGGPHFEDDNVPF